MRLEVLLDLFLCEPLFPWLGGTIHHSLHSIMEVSIFSSVKCYISFPLQTVYKVLSSPSPHQLKSQLHGLFRVVVHHVKSSQSEWRTLSLQVLHDILYRVRVKASVDQFQVAMNHAMTSRSLNDVSLKMLFEHVKVVVTIKDRVAYSTSQVWILLHVHVP